MSTRVSCVAAYGDVLVAVAVEVRDDHVLMMVREVGPALLVNGPFTIGIVEEDEHAVVEGAGDDIGVAVLIEVAQVEELWVLARAVRIGYRELPVRGLDQDVHRPSPVVPTHHDVGPAVVVEVGDAREHRVGRAGGTMMPSSTPSWLPSTGQSAEGAVAAALIELDMRPE